MKCWLCRGLLLLITEHLSTGGEAYDAYEVLVRIQGRTCAAVVTPLAEAQPSKDQWHYAWSTLTCWPPQPLARTCCQEHPARIGRWPNWVYQDGAGVCGCGSFFYRSPKIRVIVWGPKMRNLSSIEIASERRFFFCDENGQNMITEAKIPCDTLSAVAIPYARSFGALRIQSSECLQYGLRIQRTKMDLFTRKWPKFDHFGHLSLSNARLRSGKTWFRPCRCHPLERWGRESSIKELDNSALFRLCYDSEWNKARTVQSMHMSLLRKKTWAISFSSLPSLWLLGLGT